MKNIIVATCAMILIGSQLMAENCPGYAECMQSGAPIAHTYDFVKRTVDTIDIAQLIANLDATEDRGHRWYATLALAVIAECFPERIAPYLSLWADKIKNINPDKVFPEYSAPDVSHFIELGPMSPEGGLGYFDQPALTVGKACTHVLVIKDGKEIKIEETCIVMRGSGELALRNKVVAGTDTLDWSIIPLLPGTVFKIPFGTHFQFRGGENGFLAHDVCTPPWPGAQAADNTVEGYWKI